jgi:hypothetical protein
VFRKARGEPVSVDDIAGKVVAAKGFEPGDANLRAAIREKAGDILKCLQRDGRVERLGAGRGSKWKLARV